jgi:hypothetical protein
MGMLKGEITPPPTGVEGAEGFDVGQTPGGSAKLNASKSAVIIRIPKDPKLS